MINDSRPSFDDVLVAMLDEDVEPTHDQLLVWIDRFPHLAEDLADYFAAWAVQLEAEESTARINAEHFANIGVSHALNLLHTRQARARSAAASSAASVHASRRLSAIASSRGLDDRQLADRVGLDEPLIMKLDRGRISPISDIPRRLVERLSQALGEAATEIWAAIQMGPTAASQGAMLKSKGRAVIAVESFSQAIEASSLSPEKKAEWLAATAEATGPP